MSSQHLIDRPIQLKQCTRCKAYVFLCTDAGTQVAADTKPLSVEEYRECIMQNRYTFDVVTQAGRPYMLRMRGVGSKWPPYAGRNVVAEHPCTRAINMTGVDLIDPPGTPRANDTVQHGESSQSAMESLGTTNLGSPALTAILHRSRCDVCNKPVTEDQLYTGIEYRGRFEWIVHLGCW